MINLMGNVQKEYTNIEFPQLTTKQINNGDSTLALIGYESHHNPLEIIQNDIYTVVSGVININVRLREGDVGTGVKEVTIPVTNLTNIIVSPPYIFERVESTRDVECALFNEQTYIWSADDKECYTELKLDNKFECHCNKLGDIALVQRNNGVVKKKMTDYDPTYFDHGMFRFTQLVFTVAFLTALWVTTYIASMRDGIENPYFSEKLTYHPMYSILWVYSGSTPRIVRVHLLFMTFVVQLWIITSQYKPDLPTTSIMIVALLGSIVSNYVFGFLAVSLTGGSKGESTRFIFALVLDFIILGIMYLCSKNMAMFPNRYIWEVTVLFVQTILFDLLVLDNLVTFVLAKIELMKVVLAKRGFYSPLGVWSQHSPLNAGKEILLQTA